MHASGPQTAIIIGAGPAGLTAALELCRRSSIRPIVLEAGNRIGGLSCTILHNGNRIDIGGHRFFSMSDRVMDWWTSIMPIERQANEDTFPIRYQNQERLVHASSRTGPQEPAAKTHPDCVFLVRPRKSRIYFEGSFFDYPLSFSADTLRSLGVLRTIRVTLSYLASRLFPRRPEATLEDFFINRFGRELYRTFFKAYTEKVWGAPCEQIPAVWGVQRVKDLSLSRAAAHFLKRLFSGVPKSSSIAQKDCETSLIEQFLYPPLGPGQLWERVAALIRQQGGEIRLGWRVTGLRVATGPDGADRIVSVEARTPEGEIVTLPSDYFHSTMPVPELLRAIQAPIPDDVQAVSDGLVYRDFVTVGLLVDRLLITEPDGSMIKDNWIYIQEPDVLAGRMQVFNNWSPHLVSDPARAWVGLEYFCRDTDPLWKKSDPDIAAFAIDEAARIGILHPAEVRDSCVIRAPKAYPAYVGAYERFGEVVRFVDRFENLFLIGRNGMHKYNNQDHSMLTAMVSVDNILAGVTSKSNLWEVNTGHDYNASSLATRTVTPTHADGTMPPAPDSPPSSGWAAAGRSPANSPQFGESPLSR